MSCSGAAASIISHIFGLAPQACASSAAYCPRRSTRLPTPALSCSSIARPRRRMSSVRERISCEVRSVTIRSSSWRWLASARCRLTRAFSTLLLIGLLM